MKPPTCTINGAIVLPHCHGVYTGKVKPYVRRTHKTFTKEQKAYTKSAATVGAHMLCETIRQRGMTNDLGVYQTIRFLASRADNPCGGLGGRSLPLIKFPYLFGLAIDVPPVKTKSSENFGKPPGNAGDFDGFEKAMLDTARWCGLVPEDSLAWYRGHVNLDLGFRDPVSISDDGKWHFTWAFFKSLEP